MSEQNGGSVAARPSLVPAIRSSLNAKLDRLLHRPLIAELVNSAPSAEADQEEEDDIPDIFAALSRGAREKAPTRGRSGRPTPWVENRDGTCSFAIAIDYDDTWRGYEKEVRETVEGTLESKVTFLTPEQCKLLRNSPEEFLLLHPPPETADLLAYEKEQIGGVERVVSLTIEAKPESHAHLRFVAVVPNLIQLERQLDALSVIEAGGDDGPLGPLRVLVGLADPDALREPDPTVMFVPPSKGSRIDQYQTECMRKALGTPHFAVIKGPPGSGKTTVIGSIIQRAIDRGERVLVVSPTHVAVDNVVEKLAPAAGAVDNLAPLSLPVRFAARKKRLSDLALTYWVGSKEQRRGATIAARLEQRLRATSKFAKRLFDVVDEEAGGRAPLSAALSRVESVICGTPLGILSYSTVKKAAPGSFGLLIVDEVSKMTLPEFLAIAVKARRWVLVGDPDQLPPYNNAEENATTLDDLLPEILELACSVSSVLEKAKPEFRSEHRLVVVSQAPDVVAKMIQAQLAGVGLINSPPVRRFGESDGTGVIVCSPHETDAAIEANAPSLGRDRTHNPDQMGTVWVLVERGVRVKRPEVASGARFVEPHRRAQAKIFENSFSLYHAQPWALRADHDLWLTPLLKGLNRILPHPRMLDIVYDWDPGETAESYAYDLHRLIGDRFAINAVSIYDWLTGVPAECFEDPPLAHLRDMGFPPARLLEAVRPFVGVLQKQYRMHSTLSKLPRDLFYFGEALEDGKADAKGGCRVVLIQVAGRGAPGDEINEAEAEEICRNLEKLKQVTRASDEPPRVMIITPYKKQELYLEQEVARLQLEGGPSPFHVEICTLDRCQGREEEYVFISLVKNRATSFLDAPKRWNVALTRAKEGLFIFGDIDSYLAQANEVYRGVLPGEVARTSLLARILWTYDRQIAEYRKARLAPVRK
jgi:hypothetical protein